MSAASMPYAAAVAAAAATGGWSCQFLILGGGGCSYIKYLHEFLIFFFA
jgi:hypothetical protein